MGTDVLLQSHPAGSADDRVLLAALVEAAGEAAAFIRAAERDRAALRWEVKAASDFVSVVDKGAEELIRRALAPLGAATFIGEEGSPDDRPGPGLTIVCDPLDGTTNFLHGFPAYAVSLAAMVDGVLTAGVIVDVARNETFTSVRGGGAALDGRPIRVSTIDDPARALVGTGAPFRKPDQLSIYLEQLPRILAVTSGIRRAGSAALDLAHVAAGRFECFWELRLAPWDIAAGLLLVREAGGVVTDFAGVDAPVAHTGIVAGNPAMHAWLLRTLAGTVA
ncbi:MAG: inositol monophosphatase [Gemmatimonadaceae bacterium]|jgi:myo-inositol-1(or 4)-monophosphatase|nr:inositol monophosphatase [Gemmatimonadaceae bacterium]